MLLLWPLGLDLSWSKNDRVQNRFHDSSNVLQYTVVRKLTKAQKTFHHNETNLIHRQLRCFWGYWGLWCLRLNFDNSTSKFFMELWKVGFYYQKSKANLCMTNSSKDLIYLTVLSLLLHSSKTVSLRKNKRQINQNFGKVCDTEICFTFLRQPNFQNLPRIFWGQNLKIPPQTSFDLNNLKNGARKTFWK